MTNLKINGLETIAKVTGTRKEIYNTIADLNPLAVIDFRQSLVRIENENYLVILKKAEGSYKVNIIWKISGNTQFINQDGEWIERKETK